MNIHKNDQVKVIAGNSRGKTGKVLKIFRDTERIIVEGVAIIKRQTRPNAKNPQGGVVQKEDPISVSNVMLLCPKCGKQTRIGHKFVNDAITGRKKPMRICAKCDEMF